MSDINSKIIQDIPLQQRGHEIPSTPTGDTSPEAIEKARQTIANSEGAGLQSDSGRKEPSPGQTHTFTVMITKRSGEIRAVSMSAGSAEEAKAAAQSGLENGETIASVSESTVSQPDPNRGLLA